MKLTAAKRYLSPVTAIRSWRDACVFARPATGPEGTGDSLSAPEAGGHGNDPGG